MRTASGQAAAIHFTAEAAAREVWYLLSCGADPPPGLVQTQWHFIFACPLAQYLWQNFHSLFSLSQAVSF